MKKLFLLVVLGLATPVKAGETNLLFYTPPRTPNAGETVTITFTPALGVRVVGVTFLVEVGGKVISTPIRFEPPRTNTVDRVPPPLLKKPAPDPREKVPFKLGRGVQLGFDSTDRLYRSEAPGLMFLLSKKF